MSNSNESLNKQTYRTLFIGLGGTGGEVLNKLHGKLSAEQKERSHMLYLDLDKKATDFLTAKGVPTVRISSSDSVRSIMNYLGDEDGVKDWLPHDPKGDNGFLSSNTDSGASQYRVKSRLCLAKYLNERPNELTRLLDEVSAPGNLLVDETLRVMIVSSIAGGTGAGTFIQMALFLREYFRSNGHNDINIMGLFALPDLYVNAVQNDPGTKTNTSNMYSNAYAAIRELNAMNLAAAVGNKVEGYGKSINIEIKTQSEGNLFDSNDPKTSENANNRPFNRIYFVDLSSADGGILRSLDQYYAVMADIVHTRLYSALEPTIRSDEDNELWIHNNYPTAIYGSAGFGRIVYPYEGIIDYLATRKTYEELHEGWSAPENYWEKYKSEKKKEAKASGSRWIQSSEIRGERFISDMNELMGESRFMYLKAMIMDPNNSGKNRAELFVETIMKETGSETGVVKDSAGNYDGKFGLNSDKEVCDFRKKLAKPLQQQPNAVKVTVEKVVEAIKQANSTALANANAYAKALSKNIVGKGITVASKIIPRNHEDNLLAKNDKDLINIFYGLLSMDGQAIHPLAARYLLYSLRERITEIIRTYPEDIENDYRRDFNLAFDDDKEDNIDLVVNDQVELIRLKAPFSIFGKDNKSGYFTPKEAVEKYYNNYASTLNLMMEDATNKLRKTIFEKMLEPLNELIELYEKLFDNLKIFKTQLKNEEELKKRAHEQSRDVRAIFINASQREKEYIYSGDLKTREALDDCADEIASAAGLGIYEGLIARVWKKLEEKEQIALLGDSYDPQEETDDFSEMTGLFKDVAGIYAKILKDKVPHLKANVVQALIRHCCFEQGVSEDKLVDNDVRIRVRNAFETAVKNMVHKATPMLNFDRNNVDTYFEGEEKNPEVAVTKYYMHFGMSPNLEESLEVLFPSTGIGSAYQTFQNTVDGLRSIIREDSFDEQEIVCFRAVHCLQPTQIYKFRESEFRGYYGAYKKRLELIHSSNAFSNTPHLDKRWHLREAMPYISRVTEQQWRKKTVKAFVYAMLSERITQTNYNGVLCYNFQRPGADQPSLVFWPAGDLVTKRDVSKVLEYLAEQTELVEALCELYDETFKNILNRLANHRDEIPMYKTVVTNDKTLRKLYGGLLVQKKTTSGARIGHGKNASINDENAISEEEQIERQEAAKLLHGNDATWDYEMTKDSEGGLLKLAYDVHKSEELQERDYDYGEAMLELGLDLVDKLARNMYGSVIKEYTQEETEYKDLYNHILEKFIKYYVDAELIDKKQMSEERINAMKKKNGNKMIGEYFYKYSVVPTIIADTREYEWIETHWQLKK